MTARPKAGWLRNATIVLLLAATVTHANDGFFTQPTWQPVAPEAVYDRLNQYLDDAGVKPQQQAAARDLWQAADAGSDGDLLERLATALAKTDDRVAELVKFCASVSEPAKLPEFAWLADSATPRLVRFNMRLYLARWLVQEGYYDEALSWTNGLSTDDVVAPEALLFYRAVAHHRLVEADEADIALGQLLQRQDELPIRYQKLAALMQKDVAGIKEDSLDHIGRRMEDIRRRLAQGRSGDRVQEVENGVIESLDKLIEKIEKQMQQAQAAAGGTPSGQPSGAPMDDSRIAEIKGPGEIQRRDIGRGTGWGNVPEKEREKALQEIGREFPSHYREVIEEYFRRLAAEESDENP